MVLMLTPMFSQGKTSPLDLQKSAIRARLGRHTEGSTKEMLMGLEEAVVTTESMAMADHALGTIA